MKLDIRVRKIHIAALQDHKHQIIPPFQDHRHHLHTFHDHIHQPVAFQDHKCQRITPFQDCPHSLLATDQVLTILAMTNNQPQQDPFVTDHHSEINTSTSESTLNSSTNSKSSIYHPDSFTGRERVTVIFQPSLQQMTDYYNLTSP